MLGTEFYRDRLLDEDHLNATGLSVNTWTYNQELLFRYDAMGVFSLFKERGEQFIESFSKDHKEVKLPQGRTYTVPTATFFSAMLEGTLCVVSFLEGNSDYNITIQCAESIERVRNLVDRHLRESCPLQGAYIEIKNKPGLDIIARLPKEVEWADIILAESIKKTIRLATLKRLELNLPGGVILEGRPGTGKSLTCSAIATEAIRLGYTVILITGRPDFQDVEQLIRLTGKTVLIWEDMDTWTESRSNANGGYMSDFLQFTSGLNEHCYPVVYIGTTNHLEFLDPAVRDRPLRFPRIISFQSPSEEEIERHLELFFPDVSLTESQINRCKGRGFSGDFVREIAHTAKVFAHDRDLPIEEVFDEAVEEVASSFKGTIEPVGFAV